MEILEREGIEKYRAQISELDSGVYFLNHCCAIFHCTLLPSSMAFKIFLMWKTMLDKKFVLLVFACSYPLTVTIADDF